MAKMESIKKAREDILAAGPVESLPIDHFTRENEAEAELKRQAVKERLKDAPAATRHFTLLGEEDKKAGRAAQEALSAQERSVAAAYFMRKAAEEKENPKSGGESEVMPIAMQKFTMADRERKAAKRASIAEMKENPPPTSAAADYFTAKAREEKAARDAEIKAMKENPQPTTVAGAHFNEIEKVRKAEMQELIDNPPPMSEAHAYFTAKDKEEKKRMAEVEKAREDRPNPNIVATAHFDRIENEKKMAKMESIRKAREEVLAAGPVESLAVDHFTKENEALAELERRMAVDKLEDAAVATKYFTLKGKEDEKARREAQEALSAKERSVAAAYFMRKAAEEKENPKSGGESEVMPIAIQKFTMA